MAGTSTQSYDIGRPTGVCASTESAIEPGAVFVAALCEPDPAADEGTPADDRLVRRDVSLVAWESGERPERLFAFWRAVMPERDDEDEQRLEASSLLELFDQFEDAQEPKRVAFRSVLALMLLRSRVLRQVGAEKDGTTMLVVRRGDDPAGAVPVAQPELDSEALRSVVEQVRAIMGVAGDSA